MASPSVDHRTFAVPRAGSGEAEYEDATAVAAEGWPVCTAVADGATESVFARTWAEILVRGLVARKATTTEALRNAVSGWQSEWRERVRERSEGRPWYVTAKTAEGAFAALLGLSLHSDGRWRAVSVGDCCLFHMRNGALERSWPFETADAFTNRPALVPSDSDRAVPRPEATSGTWRPQDTFLLATDAVAAWLLGSGPIGPTVAESWDEKAFRSVVETGRAEGALRNDDATLLVLHVRGNAAESESASAIS